MLVLFIFIPISQRQLDELVIHSLKMPRLYYLFHLAVSGYNILLQFKRAI